MELQAAPLRYHINISNHATKLHIDAELIADRVTLSLDGHEAEVNADL